MTDTEASEEIGRVLGGKYRLTRLIGEGGMGRVFAATHEVLNKEVAVKVLLPHFADDADTAERFLREARSASALDHPGIIRVLDADRDDSGALFMVMELLEGESLAERILRSAPLQFEEAGAILRELLEALKCAHDHGVVHRDLKPDNIFLVGAGHGSRVRILDFGISRVMASDEAALRLTQTGAVLGTPYYMAPEQARGEKDLDQRVDLWAAGVILYEMLSGRRPYRGESYNAVMIAIATEPVPPLSSVVSGVDPAMASFLERALAKAPSQRFQDVARMVEALDRALEGRVSDPLAQTIAAPETLPGSTPAQGHAPTLLAPVAGEETSGHAPTLNAPPPGQPQEVDQLGHAPTEARSASPLAPTQAAPAGATPTPLPPSQAPGAPASTIPSPGPMPPQALERVGGVWRRAVALLVDVIIFSLVLGSLVDALVADPDAVSVQVTPVSVAGEETPKKPPEVSVSGVQITDEGIQVVGEDGESVRIDETGIRITDADGQVTELSDGDIAVDSTLSTSLKVSLWILYCTLFLMYFGATPGKMVMRLKVIEPSRPSEPLSPVIALVRSAFFIVSLFALALGFLWALSDPARQTWHDRIARTRVVHRPE